MPTSIKTNENSASLYLLALFWTHRTFVSRKVSGARSPNCRCNFNDGKWVLGQGRDFGPEIWFALSAECGNFSKKIHNNSSPWLNAVFPTPKDCSAQKLNNNIIYTHSHIPIFSVFTFFVGLRFPAAFSRQADSICTWIGGWRSQACGSCNFF